MDAHYPYVPAAEHDLWGGESLRYVHDQLTPPLSKEFLQGRPCGELRAIEPLYDGCIRQLDASLEYLVGRLESRDELENTLLVITSDHGEGFGERSEVTPAVRLVTHSWGIGEVLTHVPLVIKEPGQTDGTRISEVASLARFPAAVRSTIAGEPAADRFVPDDGVVVSSTYQVRPPGGKLPLPENECKPYLGPWRAVYRTVDGTLHKYAKRHTNSATLRIHDAQTSCPVGTDAEIVDSVFGGMADAGVNERRRDAQTGEEAVQSRLEKLGYLGS